MSKKKKKKKFLPALVQETEKLFVYGIFLNESTRQSYGMTNPKYATVKGYMTIGSHIVEAIPVDSEDITLSGLIVDMPKEYEGKDNWARLDMLESGYNRVEINTIQGEKAWMYEGKGDLV